MTCCDSLNLQHLALHISVNAKTLAATLLFESALACSKRFRIEFDHAPLLETLGEAAFATLLPNLPKSAVRRGPLETYEEILDEPRSLLLKRVLSFAEEGWRDCPLHYIERVALYDARGKGVLYATDSAEFILFSLPPVSRNQLLGRYKAVGIPSEVLETVQFDLDRGFE